MRPEECERLLLDCLRGRDGAFFVEQLTALSGTEWAALLGLAEELMVGPMLWHRLLSPALTQALPEQIRQTVAAEQRRITLVNLRIHAEFRRVVLALRGRGISVIALKGVHLASLVYRSLAVRTMGDIDLMVPAKDLVGAGAALEEVGYHSLRPYVVSREPVPYSWHELPRFVKVGATPIEIHWHIVDPQAPQAMPTLEIGELWRRAISASVAGVQMQVLSTEDSLLHQCIHATYAHLCAFSVRPWCDIAETIRQSGESLAWATVIERAARWRCRRGTYLALRLAHDLVKAAVPDEVLQSLRPADFDERMLMLATRQRHRVPMPTAIARLGQQRNPAARLGTWWRRVLLPKDVLADVYNLPRSSHRLYAFYLIRLKDVVKRHWGTVVRLSRGDARLTTLAGDTVALIEFLTER